MYNNAKNEIFFEEIFLEKGSNSNFKIAIDGIVGGLQTNVKIPAHDSIFILIESTVNSNITGKQFIVEDCLKFKRNGNLQQVILRTVAQDAHFFLGTKNIGANGSTLLGQTINPM